MHLIVKLDHPDFRPSARDLNEIFGGKKNPRADIHSNSSVTKEDILALNQEFKSTDRHSTINLLGVYLTEGLDFLEKVAGHSKIAVDTKWPNIEGIREDNDENKIFVLSPRAVFSTIAFSEALSMIAESRGHEPKQPELFLDCLKFTVPYSGAISPAYVDIENGGDVYSAFDNVLGRNSRIRADILDKFPKLEEALVFANAGISDSRLSNLLDKISKTDERWKPVKEVIRETAEYNSQNPTDLSRQLSELLNPKG
ncbi:MAG TPA: hypothetical protein P5277_02960 [Candidatus Paceibacterota bacterium]|nr:hypothetical protein [Candidatus Paceibacterota bacterium]